MGTDSDSPSTLSSADTVVGALQQEVAERRRAEAALRRSEERFRAVTEHAVSGIATHEIVLDDAGRPVDYVFLSANPAFETHTGLRVADILGRRVTEVLPGIEQTPLIERYGKVALTGESISFEQYVPPLGRHYLITAYRLGDRRFAVAFIDITERKRAEEALREADRRKDEFIAVLSHELRNPLAPIRYALPIIQRESLTGPASRAIGVIERQADHLTRLLDDLLDMSRVTRGQIELRRELVALASVVNAAAEAAAPAILAGRHRLTVGVPEHPIWIDADAARIVQVVTNLLDNAAKYTPRGGHIWLDTACEGGRAVVRVRDTGVGIPPEQLGEMFVMFRRLSRPGTAQGGLGIGLALSKQLIEMHDGSIEARSEGADRGAEFVVRLPLAAGTPQAEVADADMRATRHETRLRVLIVDDNADLVEMLVLLVERLGHEVRKAHDGPSAIAAALSYRPDVVLLDLGLPQISGIDVARQLRLHPDLARTRLVALTGWGQIEDRRQTSEAGFDHHLTKPTDPGKLEQLLAEFARDVRLSG